jgi:hypothetical protein
MITKYRKEYIATMAKDSGCAPAEHGFFTDAYVEWLEARLAVAEEKLEEIIKIAEYREAE